MTRYILTMLLGAIGLGVSFQATALVLCANNSGFVSAREACRPGERQLDAAALGLQGPPGTPGAPGANGVSGYEIVEAQFDRPALSSGSTIQFLVSASCPAGKKVLGGGGDGIWVNTSNTAQTAAVVSSMPRFNTSTQLYSWLGSIQKPDGAFFLEGERVVGSVFAICASAL